MKYNKLNFGCGNRFSENWKNIDFHSQNDQIQRVNLLSGFPFVDESFGAVYSSHVLEHFEREQGKFLLYESWRILKKGGILRIVVPDFQESCSEYLRILSLPDNDTKKKLYNWIIIEVLDQMVRNSPSGEMGPFIKEAMLCEDKELKDYIRSRIQRTEWEPSKKLKLLQRLQKITSQKISTKLLYWYIKIVSSFIPPTLRSMVLVQTRIGEKHRWMYDAYGLRLLFKEIGFTKIRSCAFNESDIPGFNGDHLDCNPDGGPYKKNSIYIEGTK
jgi:predicted SAM-dependent methyltransferase